MRFFTSGICESSIRVFAGSGGDELLLGGNAPIMPRDMASSRYCPACGAQTSTERIIKEGKAAVVICGVCGLTLDTDRAVPYSPIGDIIFADDSDLLRLAVQDALLQKKLANAVLSSSNGQEFLTVFTERLIAGKPVDLVMLDIKMPVLNGFNAAIAARALERAFKRSKLVPIMFFSSQSCDEKAKKILQFCKNAIYVNKVASPNLSELVERVEQVLINLITKS